MKMQGKQNLKPRITSEMVVARMKELSKEIVIPYKEVFPQKDKKMASIHFINKKK